MLQNMAGVTKCMNYYKTGHGNSTHVKKQVIQKSGVNDDTNKWISRTDDLKRKFVSLISSKIVATKMLISAKFVRPRA